MTSLFSTVMRKATRLASTQNVIEATRVIQRALAKQAPSADAPPPGRSREAGPLQRDAKTANYDERDAANGRRSVAPVKKKLGEVLESLRRADRPGFRFDPSPLLKPRLVPVPDGAAYLARSFSCVAGSRDYKVYVPSRRTSRGRPLIIMLHGCTQNPDDFALGTKMNTLAEEHGFIAAYPGQTVSANPSTCWNWFKPTDQLRDAGEPLILAGLTQAIMAEFGIDAGRVFVAGLSAGGAMAAILGIIYPELYAGVAIHSGLAYGSASDMASAFAVMKGAPVPGLQKRQARIADGRVRTIVFQGVADRTVHPSNAEAIVAGARAGLAHPWQETQQKGMANGRAYTRTVIADAQGVPQVDYWSIDGLGHAWSGGSPDGSYTDPQGPDASREMLRFFLASPAKRPER